MDFEFFKNATASAKGSNEQSINFSALRNFAKNNNSALRKDYETMEKEISDMKENLSSKKVQEKTIALNEAMKAVVNGKKSILNSILEKQANRTRQAIEKFAMIPPSQEGILRIKTAEDRIDSMSDSELLMLIKASANNYQELAYLHSVAEKHGRKFDIPFEPGEANKNLDELVSHIRTDIIEHIDDDPKGNLTLGTFFNYKEGQTVYGVINNLCEY